MYTHEANLLDYTVTLGDVIDPKKIIQKLSLSPKLSLSDNSIIKGPSNRS